MIDNEVEQGIRNLSLPPTPPSSSLSSTVGDNIIWTSGSILKLTHIVTDFSLELLVEQRGNKQYAFADPERPYDRLKMAKNGTFKIGEGSGKDILWQPNFYSVKKNDNGNEEIIAAFSNFARKNTLLGFGSTVRGDIENNNSNNSINTSLMIPISFENSISSENCKLALFKVEIKKDAQTAKRFRRVNLSVDHMHSFYQNGFLHLPNIIPLEIVNRAKMIINNALGTPGLLVPGGNQPGTGKLAGSISNHEAILSLFSNEAKYICNQLLVSSNSEVERDTRGLINPIGAQIALRFPELDSQRREVTGIDWHTDGERQGKCHPFSLLVGISLSSQPSVNSGNFIVWPTSHFEMNKKMRWPDGKIDLPEKIDLGIPMQILSNPGDLIICHPKVSHTGGPNFSCDIRYQTYFRILHQNYSNHSELLREDMWTELEGLKKVVNI